jgi:hypothetical protein
MKSSRALSVQQAMSEFSQRGFGVYQATGFAGTCSQDLRVTVLDRTAATGVGFRWEQHTNHDDGLPFRSTSSFTSLIDCLENGFLEMFGEPVNIIGD